MDNRATLLAFVCWVIGGACQGGDEVDPNLWTKYPGVSVNDRIPRQEKRKWERPTPLPASWGERRPAEKVRQFAAAA